MAPAEVAAEVNKASLLGRGGAGFPAGRKWSMLRKAATTYLVVNGDESEPATFKDHMLIESDPHQIIEGTAIAAYATGVEQAFIYCRGEFALAVSWHFASTTGVIRRGPLPCLPRLVPALGPRCLVPSVRVGQDAEIVVLLRGANPRTSTQRTCPVPASRSRRSLPLSYSRRNGRLVSVSVQMP
jgi:hypothetical protein